MASSKEDDIIISAEMHDPLGSAQEGHLGAGVSDASRDSGLLGHSLEDTYQGV